MSGFNNMQEPFREALAKLEKKKAKDKEKQVESTPADKPAPEAVAPVGGSSKTSETVMIKPEDQKEYFEGVLKSLEMPDEIAETRARVKAKTAALKVIPKEIERNDGKEAQLTAIGEAAQAEVAVASRKAKSTSRARRKVLAKPTSAKRKKKLKKAVPLDPQVMTKTARLLKPEENNQIVSTLSFVKQRNTQRVVMTHGYWYVLVEGLSEDFKQSVEVYDIGELTFMTRDEFKRILKEKKRLGHNIQVLPTEKVVARDYKKKGNLVGKWDENDGTGWVYRVNRAKRLVKDQFDIHRAWKDAAMKQGAKRFAVERPDVYSLENTHEEKVMIVEDFHKDPVDKKAVKKFVKEGGKIKTTKRQVTAELKKLAKSKRKDPKKVLKRRK